MAEIPDDTPVLVGVGTATQRVEEPGAGLEAVELMVAAVDAAAEDSGVDALASTAGWVGVPEGMWGYTDPGRLIAESVGAIGAHTVLAEVGILQQDLISRACGLVANGEVDVAVVVGGEAKYRQQLARRAGLEAAEVSQSSGPTETIAPETLGIADLEIIRNVVSPVAAFALIENALRFADGLDVAGHRAGLGALWSELADVASRNPSAWDRSAPSAERIAGPSATNPMLEFPYTKLLSSQWNVDQAAALILCTAGVAERLGVPRERWVFALGSAVSNHAVPVAQRRELHRSPGAALAGEQLALSTGIDLAAVDHVDLYSCFPAAFQVLARELGRAADRSATVTGGMTFAGGPLNNYVLQALARLVELLRADPGSTGLSTSVSGFLTKQGLSLWSTEPPTGQVRHLDVTGLVADESDEVPLVDDAKGQGRVVGYTVDHRGGAPERVVALIEFADGARTIAASSDRGLAELVMADEWIGETVVVDAAGQLTASGGD